MLYTVDVELNVNTLELVNRIFNFQVNRFTNLLNGSSTVNVKEDSNLFSVLFKIIESAILRKLQSKVPESLDGLQISSEDLFHEGNGSIQINNPPSKAQEKLVDSLLKVLFSQFVSVTKSNYVENGHDNLVLSLFIENIYVEPYSIKSPISLNNNHGSLDEIINSIFLRTQVDENKTKDDQTDLSKFDIYFYHFKDEENKPSKEILVEEFDKIDISNSGQDRTLIEETKTNTPLDKTILPNFRFSEETLNLVSITALPSPDLENLWESLFYNGILKQAIFNSTVLSLKISQQKSCIEQQPTRSKEQMINNNGLLLLHGPPGTGKTSLCRAVCQKLSIRQKYNKESITPEGRPRSILVELSCSRIFSRWFGESSKNISCIFNDIELLLQSRGNNTGFICLLIDEVETIASCRTKSINNNESNESVRVVNSLLTNLDKLKKYDNFIVLTTSNYIDTLDCAFVDRADRIFHVTKPSLEALESILISSLESLMCSNILIPIYGKCSFLERGKYKNVIRILAKQCLALDLSGRALRKVPLICLSEYFQDLPVNVDSFLIALADTINKYQESDY
ncbi:similar to Saccharomyces cerevisiae YBR186W PCH2 Nucleolar component of the pachytene checkpoint [Maudiozyma saulgeensis]|uniref:Similar to Saccharomyces cerevisiae YBR186W PCH2 Nucleolar component of the pachytene checkpoint n=1 Tax=Maudiozyma saulgeensis TaxID=1789683 RepID=A0A1X7R6D4_9SACH|nr:similar to Saccharomyces cerevisiae YBR186W PCH2 Nucleolar component of the pachytene checkpoint [Kazachstania saulgeensis]